MPHQSGSLRMALVLPVLLLAAASSRLPAQDFEGILTARARGMPEGSTMRILVKEGRSRLEMTMAGQGEIAIIADPAKGETYMVMPAQSMYMVMKMSEVERMADSLIRRQDPGESSMTPTGGKDQVAGHTCEIYRARSEKGAVDICMASGMGTLRLGASLFAGPPRPGRPQPAPAWARELLRKGLFPLRVADTTGVMIWEAVAVEPKSLDAALFAPPANFQRMEMPFGRPPAF